MFWFRLAAQLGKTVEQCQREVSSAEFCYWVQYWKHYALDADGWQQAATICATVAASAGAKRVRPSDFMPTEQHPQTQAEMSAVMEAFCNG